MTFGNPQFLYCLLLVPIAAAFFVWSSQHRRNLLAKLGNPASIHILSDSINHSGRWVRTLLWIIAITVLVIASAQPQWGSHVTTVDREGVQIIVALDISRSMLAEDLKPNRLERAKLEITDLMTKLNGDEIGLVLFSGTAFLQSPLTFDYRTTMTLLSDATPKAITRQGTAVATAINTALDGFDEYRSSQKVILIMTDGESHEGDALSAARIAAAEGVILFTIGFGSSDGSPIPEHDDSGRIIGYKKDQYGETILSKLDEVMLQQIAQEANGKYFRANTASGSVDDLVSEINSLQKTSLNQHIETQHIERFQMFAAMALFALTLSELIPDRRGMAFTNPWLIFLNIRRQLGRRIRI